ncbi:MULTISPECIES: Chromate resistance protein ChrB [Streptomyces]|uniref:Chromate resistance protein n=1 Tax=Streptomyces amritsarensis TaxID=681158 RepID=A0ABX3FZK6_9ACTN|nr:MULTISPECIES: Chromate resistance protein ChrB [Streptomyces]AQT76285.1 chromate resistance protein [Streptomyces sp. fd1-xmd]OLZ63462.1 chromate resistance protein [Streptomyces amritsarensis]
MSGPGAERQWVLLSYRLPREPSTPRITVWRKLKRMGVAQISDGLVALPADARTREQLDWIAEEVTDFGGTATVWIAHPAAAGDEQQLIDALTQARAAEYQQVRSEAEAAGETDDLGRRRALTRLRAELRRIQRRDYFPPPDRHAAEQAVNALHPANTRKESTP